MLVVPDAPPLASNFPLLQGWVTVVCPDVEPADDYRVLCESQSPWSVSRSLKLIGFFVVFGDSSNYGPLFTITSA